MKHSKVLLIATLFGCLATGFNAHAISMQLGGPDKYATLSSATAGATGTGNGTVSDLNSQTFGGFSTWVEIGEETSSGQTGLLDVVVNGGVWGGAPVDGTWSILDATFWSNYVAAAISMHVGNGQGDPDHFIWLLETGPLNGTWSYDVGQTGLSNLKLYGVRGQSRVPDAGATLALLGFGLAVIGVLRRRLRA